MLNYLKRAKTQTPSTLNATNATDLTG